MNGSLGFLLDTSVAGLTLLTTDKDFLTVLGVAALDVRVLDSKTGLVQP
jgi:hypothetical protein